MISVQKPCTSSASWFVGSYVSSVIVRFRTCCFCLGHAFSKVATKSKQFYLADLYLGSKAQFWMFTQTCTRTWLSAICKRSQFKLPIHVQQLYNGFTHMWFHLCFPPHNFHWLSNSLCILWPTSLGRQIRFTLGDSTPVFCLELSCLLSLLENSVNL